MSRHEIDDSQLRTLRSRTLRLERLVVLQTVALAVLGSLFLFGATSGPDILDASRIRTQAVDIVGEDGRVLATLGSSAQGGALSLFGLDETRTVRIGNDDRGGLVQIFHQDGRMGVSLNHYAYTTSKTGGIVVVYDQDEQPTVTLGTGDDYGGPVGMGAHYDGGAVVVLRDGALYHLGRPEREE